MRACNFGRKAAKTNIPPMNIPTRREATPVSSVTEIELEYVVFGTIAKHPESKLPKPSAPTAP